MKYLIDTHTLIWTLFEDERLSQKAKNIVEDVNNELYVSIISYWEISLKFSIGKLDLNGISPDELPEKAVEIGILPLEANAEDASSFYLLPKLMHKDPFDRLIIWQAIRRGMTLISKDKKFEDYRNFGLKSLW